MEKVQLADSTINQLSSIGWPAAIVIIVTVVAVAAVLITMIRNT